MTNEDRPREALARLRQVHGGWLDENPFYLMIVLTDRRFAEIDLGERGWLAKYGETGFLRDPGTWYLVRKEGQQIVAMVNVNEGDQPYYVAKHVGFTSVSGSGPTGETIVYGIGKKRPDGMTDRLWVMSNGTFAVGEDIDQIAITLLKQGHLT